MLQITASRFLASLALALAVIFLTLPACRKKPAASPGTGEGAVPVGSIQPAIVSRDARSFASYIHFPKDPAVANEGGAVQFYCDVTAAGTVEQTYTLLGNQNALKEAVQHALDWGRFQPAMVNGRAVPVYLGGTVLFLRENGSPVIVVSLATEDRNRVGKLANYIQPQIIGGLRPRIEHATAKLPPIHFVKGGAEVVVQVTGEGRIASTKVKGETPAESGYGAFVEGALKETQFTPAYNDGKPAAGAINVIATFGQ